MISPLAHLTTSNFDKHGGFQHVLQMKKVSFSRRPTVGGVSCTNIMVVLQLKDGNVFTDRTNHE